MRYCPRKYRSGISSVVGIAALILIFIAIVGFLLTILYRLTDFTQTISRVLEERAESESIVRTVHGVWSNGDPFLTINITSQYPQAILLTGLTVVFTDGTKLILSRYNTTLNNESYVIITKPNNTYIKTNLQLPITLGPGHTITIQIPSNYLGNRRILTVTAILANPSTLVALPLNQK